MSTVAKKPPLTYIRTPKGRALTICFNREFGKFRINVGGIRSPGCFEYAVLLEEPYLPICNTTKIGGALESLKFKLNCKLELPYYNRVRDEIFRQLYCIADILNDPDHSNPLTVGHPIMRNSWRTWRLMASANAQTDNTLITVFGSRARLTRADYSLSVNKDFSGLSVPLETIIQEATEQIGNFYIPLALLTRVADALKDPAPVNITNLDLYEIQRLFS